MVFLLATIAVATCFIVVPKSNSGILRPLLAFTITLAIVQILLEGYYWQFLPSYLLILVLIAKASFFKETKGNIQKKIVRIVLFLLVLASIAPWTLFLPIPTLTDPQGPYAVGTKIFRWTDPSRAEEVTPDPDDKRNVVVQAWYPTEQDAKGPHSSYLDGMDSLPEKIAGIPRFVFKHYDQIETHGVLNAPISKNQHQWPVVLFLTGNSSARAFYTSLATGLASHGFVVLTIDHPFEAMITQLADGQVVTPIEVFRQDEPDLLQFMKRRLDLRTGDIQFVLNQLDDPNASPTNFLSSLDRSRIVITGHSLGGATAAVAMALDSRIKAAANIDGTLYGDLPEPSGPRPFLLLESKKNDSDRFLRYENGNQKLFKQFEGGYRYEITEADHYSFTDAPLLLAPPARFLAGHILEFGNSPVRTQNATVDILTNFFQGALNGRLSVSDIDAIAVCHQGIVRKSIK